MTLSTRDARDAILSVDIGATLIKFCVLDERGELVEPLQTVPTPYPCPPSRLIEVVARQIDERDCDRIGVGFPGDMIDGRVLEPGNLARVGGILTPVDSDIEGQWRDFDLQGALRAATRRDVRVVNDATLAAYGCAEGHLVELVFTLGTGFGIALVVDGRPVKIRDVGAELFADGDTYDEALGEPSRARDEERWRVRLHRAVVGFIAEFDADVIHLAGGNARHVEPADFADLGVRVVVNDNLATMRGALRLFSAAIQ
ncbi:MAG TPA: ROK family protein [Acidimicrobiales bacterium]|nr:ROK family protein [Acidimicrobiales bacterium]